MCTTQGMFPLWCGAIARLLGRRGINGNGNGDGFGNAGLRQLQPPRLFHLACTTPWRGRRVPVMCGPFSSGPTACCHSAAPPRPKSAAPSCLLQAINGLGAAPSAGHPSSPTPKSGHRHHGTKIASLARASHRHGQAPGKGGAAVVPRRQKRGKPQLLLPAGGREPDPRPRASQLGRGESTCASARPPGAVALLASADTACSFP